MITNHTARLAAGRTHGGRALVTYEAPDVSPDMSFLEMLDVLNERSTSRGRGADRVRPRLPRGDLRLVRLMINGAAHGPMKGAATCQLHMRSFKDGDEIVVEPWRARAFPVIKDLVVDRGALDRIIQAGGFISANTGGARDANAILVPKPDADARDGRGGVHRLRRVRGGLPERVGVAVHGRQGLAPRPAAAGAAGALPPRRRDGRTDGPRGVRPLQPVRDHLAATSKPAARGASGGAGNAHVNEQSPDERPFTDSETALGGADSVQKTTWGVGHGTEPTGEDYMPVGRKKGEGPVVARVAAGGGMSPIALVVGVLGLLALLVYAFGAFRS
jgi:hypothetical protein